MASEFMNLNGVISLEHPIEGLFKTAMESIRGMVDVDTVVGNPVETTNGTVIIPVSRVTCGFAAGGSALSAEPEKEGGEIPFGGGSGAGVSVQPVGFLVVNGENVRLLSVDGNHVVERLIDLVPQILGKLDEVNRRC